MSTLRYIALSILQSKATSGPVLHRRHTQPDPCRTFHPCRAFATATDKYVCGLPVAYLVRPEINSSRFKMLLRPCHLDDGHATHAHAQMRQAVIAASQNADSDAHVCDIGATGHDNIAKTVVALVEVLQQTTYPDIPQSVLRPGWQVRVIVPCWVADALDRDDTQETVEKGVDVVIEEDGLGQRTPVRASGATGGRVHGRGEGPGQRQGDRGWRAHHIRAMYSPE